MNKLKSLIIIILTAIITSVVTLLVLKSSVIEKSHIFGKVEQPTVVNTEDITTVNQADTITEVADALPNDTEVTIGSNLEEIAASENAEPADNASLAESSLAEENSLDVLLERYPDYIDEEAFGYTTYEVPSTRKILIQVDNKKDARAVGIGLVVFYDENNNVIDASSYATGVIDNLGSTFVYVFTPETYSSYKLRLMPDYLYYDYATIDYDNVNIQKEEYGNIFGMRVINREPSQITVRYALLIVYKDGVPIDVCVSKPLKTNLERNENTTVTFTTKFKTYDDYKIVFNAYKN